MVFDLSPSFVWLEKCIFLAVDEVITSLDLEYFAVNGIGIFKYELDKLSKGFGVDIKHSKVVINKVNKSFERHEEMLAQLKQLDYEFFGIGKIVNLGILNLKICLFLHFSQRSKLFQN